MPNVVPNVVMVGDCGTGKSTAVEKMSGVTGLRSNSKLSGTRHQGRYVALNGAFCIVDTPGQNSQEDRLHDNMELAMALNEGAVSLLLCTTQANVRLASVVSQLDTYVDRFIDFSDLLCILVTHMDDKRIQWSEQDCRDTLDEHYGISKVLFTGTTTNPSELVGQVEGAMVKPPQDFSIDSQNFLQYFELGGKKIRIINQIKKQRIRYAADVRSFQEQLDTWSEKKRADQIFQFNTYMTNEIATEQAALAAHFKWDFASTVEGLDVKQQCGYIAQMASSMKAELFKIRTIMCDYHVSSGVSNLRKCPHCGRIWGKWEGCDGSTTCGNRPGTMEYRNGSFIGFTFSRNSGTLSVTESRTTAASAGVSGTGEGCGGSITWSAMVPVTEGDGWTLADINNQGASQGIVVSDVKPLGNNKGNPQVSFDKIYQAALTKCRLYADRSAVIGGGA